MKKFWFVALLMLFWAGVQAQSLQPQTFEDQFGEKLTLSASTQWLVFSYDKSGGDWVRQALNELNYQDLAARDGLYVADISAMPSLITRMFALPKMREYAFKMALDRDGTATANWSRVDGTVSLMRLDKLNVIELKQANSPEQIKAFLAQF